jgi:hypothetical protein
MTASARSARCTHGSSRRLPDMLEACPDDLLDAGRPPPPRWTGSGIAMLNSGAHFFATSCRIAGAGSGHPQRADELALRVSSKLGSARRGQPSERKETSCRLVQEPSATPGALRDEPSQGNRDGVAPVPLRGPSLRSEGNFVRIRGGFTRGPRWNSRSERKRIFQIAARRGR